MHEGPPALVFLVFAIFAALVVSGGIYAALAARKRREGLFELAQRLDLNFNPPPDHGLAERYGFLKELAQGENRYAYNVLSGRFQDNDVLAFDYHYEITTHDKNGSHTTDYTFSFFILKMP